MTTLHLPEKRKWLIFRLICVVRL